MSDLFQVSFEAVNIRTECFCVVSHFLETI